MKISSYTPIVGLLLCLLTVHAQNPTVPLGEVARFTSKTTTISYTDAGGNFVMYLSFTVSRGCDTFKCNMTAQIIPFSIPSGSNMPSNSTLIDLGLGGQAVNVSVSPTSPILSNFTVSFPKLTSMTTGYAGFVYDPTWNNFGYQAAYLDGTAGASITSQADFFVSNIWLLATLQSTDPIPMSNGERFALTGSTPTTFSVGNSVTVTIITNYDNAILFFQSKSNPGATIGPDGYTAPKSWYNIVLRDPYYQGTGALTAFWSYRVANPNTTILAFNGLTNGKTWNTFAFNDTRFVLPDGSVNVTTNNLAGTWGFYSTNSAATQTISMIIVVFAIIMSAM